MRTYSEDDDEAVGSWMLADFNIVSEMMEGRPCCFEWTLGTKKINWSPDAPTTSSELLKFGENEKKTTSLCEWMNEWL